MKKIWNHEVYVGKLLRPCEVESPAVEEHIIVKATIAHNNAAFGCPSSHSEEPQLNDCVEGRCQGWNNPLEIQVASAHTCARDGPKELSLQKLMLQGR